MYKKQAQNLTNFVLVFVFFIRLSIHLCFTLFFCPWRTNIFFTQEGGGTNHFLHTMVGGLGEGNKYFYIQAGTNIFHTRWCDVGNSGGLDDADGEETEGVNKGNTSRREASKLSAGAIIH